MPSHLPSTLKDVPEPKRREELERTNKMNERKTKGKKRKKELTLEPKSRNAEEPGPKRKRGKEVRTKLENEKREQRDVKQELTCI